MATKKKGLPDVTEVTLDQPEVTVETKELPKVGTKQKDMPIVGKPENIVKIGGKFIEILPTKLRYQRDRTAAFYNVLEMYAQADVFAMPEGTFGDSRDGDKCVMDWLIAVTNDPELILENYNDIDTQTIEDLIIIFKRINKIEEKSERRKNLQGKKGVMS